MTNFFAEEYARNVFTLLRKKGINLRISRVYIYRDELSAIFSTMESVDSIITFLYRINAIEGAWND
jgi:hypothetical protein